MKIIPHTGRHDGGGESINILNNNTQALVNLKIKLNETSELWGNADQKSS